VKKRPAGVLTAAIKGTILGVLIFAIAAGTYGYRKAYGSWWPQTPERITYCGRTYETNHSLVLSRDGVTRSETKTSLPGDAPYPVVTVARVPPVIGRPLLAAVTPEARRRGNNVPCAMGVYLKTGSDTYLAYGLIGGP
jgi:hypothetical protein